MTAPPTTGLSVSVSGGGSDQDECVCTYSCEGVHLHQMREYIEEGEEEKRLKEEQALGIKYCPGMEMELPKYKCIEYKPRGSKDKPKLLQGFSVGGGGENSESSLLSDISSSEQSQQHISANLDMNISTKPTILKILEKLKAGGLDTSTLPGPRKIIRKQLNLCVSRDMAGGTMEGGTPLVGQPANQKRARESDGHYLVWGQTKKLKFLLSEDNLVIYI